MAYVGANPKFTTQTYRPQSADPSNPIEGAVFYSDGTSRTEGLWVYMNGAWALVGSTAATINFSNVLANFGFATSVSSSALTITAKTSAGATLTGSDKATVGFRNGTATTGQFSLVEITSEISLVISSGSTLGQRDGVESYIYVYLINNAGTAELAVSRMPYDDGSIVSTTAEGGAGAADSSSTIYSTTARSNVAIRMVGRIKNTQTTAGTWASAGSELSLLPFDKLDLSCLMFKTSAQNPGTTAATKITWESVAAAEGGFDPWSMCDLTNDRLVCRKAGRYEVVYNLSASNFDASATIQEIIYKNGSAFQRADYISAGVGNTRDLKQTFYIDLALNDYLEIFTASAADSSYQISGVSGLNDSTSWFGMKLIK